MIQILSDTKCFICLFVIHANFLTVIEVKMCLLSTQLVLTHRISTVNYSFSRQIHYRNKSPVVMKHSSKETLAIQTDVFSGSYHLFFSHIAFLLMIASSSRSTLLILMLVMGYARNYVLKLQLFENVIMLRA